MNRFPGRIFKVLAFAVCVAFLSPRDVAALDLEIESIQINQVIQLGDTTLIGGRPTLVRVTIDTNGANVAGVDAILRVIVNGEPTADSPMNSINGPITAATNPVLSDENDTINFFMIPPASGDVDLIVEVNPAGPGRIEETDFDNNLAVEANAFFECRKTLELVHVPIDYRPSGGNTPNLPPEQLINSKVGAGFVRAIFPAPDWNYHEYPMPPLLFTANINFQSSSLLNQLSEIRTMTIPGQGFPRPNYIFGWLPGNPFNGNGQANGLPGDAAFGNTSLSRFQRTFAHELGHLFGLFHVFSTIGAVGIDVEEELAVPLDLERVKDDGLFTIMVAGLQTPSAWIDSDDYEFVASRNILQCSPAPESVEPMLFVTGIVNNETGQVSLGKIVEAPPQSPSSGDADANLAIEAFDSLSVDAPVMHRVAVNSKSAADRCDAPNEVYETSPLRALIPTRVGVARKKVQRIVIRDVDTGAMLAERKRSPNAPQIHLPSPNATGVIDRPTRIQWSGTDADGDDLIYSLLYSHDNGESWYVLGVDLRQTYFDVDPSRIAGSRIGKGRLRLVATDGMNTTVAEVGLLTLGEGSPPAVELLYPNDGDTFFALTPILFHGTNWDMEDLQLGDELMEWSSDVEGVFAHGRLTQFDLLDPGEHTLTLSVEDDDGMIGSESITITIVDRNVDQGDCNTNGFGDIDDILTGFSDDCNRNRIPDECDIADGILTDFNNQGGADTCEGLGDFDSDGDRDVHDFASFVDCVTGPNVTAPVECQPADIDGDGDVDFSDYGFFSRLTGGLCGVTIVAEPVNLAVCNSGTAVFSIGALGDDLRFQWLFNGEAINGATDSEFVLNNVNSGDKGAYSVVIFNTCDAKISAPASLSVAEPPSFTQQPQSQLVCPGNDVMFTVAAQGAEPLTYQWQRSGVSLPGETGTTLTIGSVGEPDIGVYRCIVTDACPSSTTSNQGVLQLDPPVVFTLHPQTTEACVGGFLFLSAGADGADSFQWFKDGVAIPGQDNTVLFLNNISADAAGKYHAAGIGPCGTVSSDVAVVTVSDCG